MNLSTLFASNPALTLGLIMVGVFFGLFIRGKPVIMLLFLAALGYYGFMGNLFLKETHMKEEIIQHGGFERALQVRAQSYSHKTLRELERYDL